ncbi:PIN domain-containing protein [Nocardia sp. NPDC050718]|uniref:type II toxin-antitoxin system VapC family toxin n=1 Tax=Nocardia sp. NPDC050718 TaxID=3155788 RepID=UPI0033D2A28D
MTKPRPRVVVDTCVVVDLLTNIDPSRARNSAYLLAGHNDRHDVILPAIVLAEIAGTGEIRGGHLTAALRDDRVNRALKWISDSKFMVAELSERLGREAAKLAVEHQLKGPDATVLATAVAWKCQKLYTRDHGILKCDGKFNGLKILEPESPPPPEPTLFPGL